MGTVAAKEQGPFTEFRLQADDLVSNDQYGRSVAMDGDLVAVGMGGDGAIGAAYLYKRQGMTYVSEAKLEFPEPDEIPETCPEKDVGNCPEFGRIVAIHGNTVFVGARFAPVGDLKAGAVYVFRKDGDSWQYVEKITSATPGNEDNFGRALAIRGDLLVVTARKENLADSDIGAAYVYRFQDGTYQFQQKLTAGDPSSFALFGQSVAVQGDLIAISARNATPNAAGAVYLFNRSGDLWEQVTKITPAGGKKNDQFGFTITMSGDVLAVGARRADPSGMPDAGAVYLYSLTDFSLIKKLTGSDIVAGDEFGQSVAMAGDTLAVGAWKQDIGVNGNQGSIYLFRNDNGKWTEVGKIIASDGMVDDEFGYSLAAFGNRIVTGAHFADEKAGTAYVLAVR